MPNYRQLRENDQWWARRAREMQERAEWQRNSQYSFSALPSSIADVVREQQERINRQAYENEIRRQQEENEMIRRTSTQWRVSNVDINTATVTFSSFKNYEDYYFGGSCEWKPAKKKLNRDIPWL